MSRPELPRRAQREAGSRSPAAVIFRKEVGEIFRDRRTVMSVVISPLLITPLLFALMGSMITSQTEKTRTKVYRIGLIRSDSASEVAAALPRYPNVKVVALRSGDAQNAIQSHTVDAAIDIPPETQSRVNAGLTAPLNVLLDAGNETSQAAANRIAAAVAGIGQKLVTQRLAAHGLSNEVTTPFKIVEQPIKEGGSAATMLLSMMLPYILTVAAFSGAIYAANDQVAGEKERGTLETLLVSPASRQDIVLGKFGAVVTTCLISSVLSIAGMALSFGSGLKAYDWIARGGFHLSPVAIVVTMLVMLPLSVLFAGLLLAVSTFARNQKEAQTYLAPLFIVVLLPAMASMIIGTDVALGIALVPVLNAAVIIKQALSGTYDAVFLFVAFTASAAYAALALLFATRLFQKESVLIKV